MITEWNVACDKRLHRSSSYTRNTAPWQLVCFVGDEPQDCNIGQLSYAYFGGDLGDSKSTTGTFFCLIGPNTWVPLPWICKKQGAVLHSSTEAELISLGAGLRMEGTPALTLWSDIPAVLSLIEAEGHFQQRKRCRNGGKAHANRFAKC